MTRFILASTSPRRREILSFFSYSFEVIPPSFDEGQVAFFSPPADFVCHLACEKARSVANDFPQSYVLGADTLVFHEGQPLGKPRDIDEAFSMLCRLRGRWHEVISAISFHHQGSVRTSYDTTRVLFHDITDEQIRAYLDAIPCLDKAGSYAIQGPGGALVKKIEGCFYNVMGLPLSVLIEGLSLWGKSPWSHLAAYS